MRTMTPIPAQQPAPAHVSLLKPNRGYWVKANVSGNLTFKGIGGSLQNETYNWSDLMFSNGTDWKNISAAVGSGWVENDIKYYDLDIEDYSSVILDRLRLLPWQGYWINSKVNNLTLIRQD